MAHKRRHAQVCVMLICSSHGSQDRGRGRCAHAWRDLAFEHRRGLRYMTGHFAQEAPCPVVARASPLRLLGPPCVRFEASVDTALDNTRRT